MATQDQFTIHPYTPTDKPGRYDDEVMALIAANEAADSPQSIDILVPADEVAKHKRYFQVSAKNHGRTGRAVNETPQGDGSVLVEFIVVDQIVRKSRKPKGEADEAPVEDADTPVAA